VLWLSVLGLFVAVVSAWSKLRTLLIWLLMAPVRLAFVTGRAITCPEPFSWQVGNAVDRFAVMATFRLGWHDPERFPRLFTASHVRLTTWLWHPSWAIDSYRRHLSALREFGPGPRDDALDTLRDWLAGRAS